MRYKNNKLIISTILAAICVFFTVLYTRDIQSRVTDGKRGQTAIKTLDEVRRPFLTIHSAEVSLLKDGYRKSVRDDLEQKITNGLRLISDFKGVAAYNPELFRRVEKLADTFDEWIKIERTFFDQSAGAGSADVTPLSNVGKLAIITESAEYFSLTMDALGDAEIPIHKDIHEGSRAVTELVITGGILVIVLISILFSVMYYKNKTLRMVLIERENTESRLHESEEQLRQIAENIPGIVWMSDPELRVVNYISPGYEKIFGRTSESLYENPVSFLEAVHDDDREYLLNALKKYGRGDYNVEYRIVRPDGAIRWIWAHGFPLRDEEGMIYRITGIAQDITERKQSEEKISWLSQAVEQSPGIFMITDYKGNIEFVNPKFTQLTGYIREEVMEQNPRFLSSGKTTIEEYKRIWEVITSGGTWIGEFQNRKKNGEFYWESASISSIKNKDGVIASFVKVAEDITKRRRAEEEIKRLNETLEQRIQERTKELVKANREIKDSEERYSDLFENVNDMIQSITLDGRFIYVNNAWKETLGYGMGEIDKLTLFDIIHPDSLAHYMEIFNRLISGDRIENIEAIFVAKDGRQIIVEGSVNCRFEDGKPVAARGIFRNITGRKRTEDELKMQSSYCRLLRISATSANVALNIKDAFQPVLEEICSYTDWEIGHAYVVSKDDPEMLEPTGVWYLKDQERFNTFCDVSKNISFTKGIGLPGRVLASHKPLWIVDVTKDSNFLRKQIALDLNIKSGIAFPVMVGCRVAAIMTFFTTRKIQPDQQFMDIMADIGTQLGRFIERRQMEETLRNSEERLLLATKASNDAIWDWDITNGKVWWNDTYNMLFGERPEKTNNSWQWWIDHIHPEDRYQTMKSIKSSINGNDNYWTAEYRFLRVDGSYANLIDRAFITRDKQGKAKRILGAMLDITERKKMEEALIQSEKLKSMGIMASGIAHEFNNILSVISSNAQLLEKTYRSDKQLLNVLRIICRLADDGSEIVDRMYEFIHVYKDSFRFINVDVNDLIEQVIDFTMPRWMNIAHAGGIKYQIVRKCARTLPSVLGNPSELREVLLNIINNALDAMPEGGAITVKTRKIRSSELNVRSEEGRKSLPDHYRRAGELRTNCSELKGDYAEISFEDTGNGMSEEVRRMIFDPFFTTKSPLGTGLGMSVSYGIIKRHGGDISVESVLGKGSKIILRLPVS